MVHAFVAAFAAFLIAAATGLPTPLPSPNAAEARFVRDARNDVLALFPTVATAINAGYLRYSDADASGAISYANLRWTSSDARHPSRLRYDARGKLVAADYSEPQGARPQQWGLSPMRWTPLDAHIQYISVERSTGRRIYGLTVARSTFVGAGGDPEHPTASTLVKLGLVQHVGDVAAIFFFPAVWDIGIRMHAPPSDPFTAPALPPLAPLPART